MSGRRFHETRTRSMLPKGKSKAWARPQGCECSDAQPRDTRCAEGWMRCAARIDFVRREKLAALGGVPRPTDATNVTKGTP